LYLFIHIWYKALRSICRYCKCNITHYSPLSILNHSVHWNLKIQGLIIPFGRGF